MYLILSKFHVITTLTMLLYSETLKGKRYWILDFGNSINFMGKSSRLSALMCDICFIISVYVCCLLLHIYFIFQLFLQLQIHPLFHIFMQFCITFVRVYVGFFFLFFFSYLVFELYCLVLYYACIVFIFMFSSCCFIFCFIFACFVPACFHIYNMFYKPQFEYSIFDYVFVSLRSVIFLL